MKKVRCAIYTRKSSEEGMEQEFNSLHAQREACVSYIASQKHEGWVLMPNHYDDGGISGGTLERDGLKQLMQDVDNGLVDQIVVYKIDRLTRSLADFAKLVDRLDVAEASFVSVTQSFNTATSMGRLTLNVLLSFAQFEREVTAERIRDKITASKKKGLWMGGTVPLGYEPNGRTLKINHQEAETVKTIYRLYEKHRNIVATVMAAQTLGLRAKGKTIDGEQQQGALLTRGPIYYILTNPVYAGKIRHKDKIYEGQHEAIIDDNVWEMDQTQLIEGSKRQRGSKTGGLKSALVGKLFDETGDHLTQSHANKQGRRYRYYVSNRLIKKPSKSHLAKVGSDTGCKSKVPDKTRQAVGQKGGWRLPAQSLEQQVTTAIMDHIEAHIGSDLFYAPEVEKIELTQAKLNVIKLAMKTKEHNGLLSCLSKATIKVGSIKIELDAQALADELDLGTKDINPDFCTFDTPFQHRKRGVETKLVIGNPTTQNNESDQTLIENIARAHHYYDAIKQGQTFDQVALSNHVTKRRLLQLIDLAFLSPDIVKAIIIGDQPTGLTSKWLGQNPLPANWNQQREITSRL